VNEKDAVSQETRKFSLLGMVGEAQFYLGVDFVLDVKREMFGTTRKLNDLENYELNQLIGELREIYVKYKKTGKKVFKRPFHKRIRF
jgi:hypothetical protein